MANPISHRSRRPVGVLPAIKGLVKWGLRPVIRAYSPKRVDLSPALWKLDSDAVGCLSLEGVNLMDLLRKWDSPLHVVHAAKLQENAKAFLSTPEGTSQSCEVFYSYKTNPVPGVLKLLHGVGVGAEVISEYELWLALELGVPPEKIVYNGPAKSPASIREAISREICLINVNDREEIGRISGLAEALDRKARIGIRVTTGGGWGGQFGIPIAGGQALAAFSEARDSPHLDVIGLHAHLGAPIRDGESLRVFVGELLEFSDVLYRQLKLDPEILDLGGSLATPTVARLGRREKQMNVTFLADLVAPNVSKSLSISQYTSTIVALVEEHSRRTGRRVPRIFLEPGRAMTANSQMLLTSVMSTKKASDSLTYAILDAGINLAEPVQNEFHQLFLLDRSRRTPHRTYRLAGPICTPADMICAAWQCPELEPGDSIAIMDAGAYFVPFSTSFAFPRPAIVLVDAGCDILLRRAETFRDLIAYDEAVVDGLVAQPGARYAAGDQDHRG